VRATWDEAFAAIGSKLKAIPAKAMTFYASARRRWSRVISMRCGRGRWGTNNLPDSSNMCHETTLGA
jgi:anaerobic selenocysteine-containing dehydrogenase